MLDECFQPEFNKSISGPRHTLSKNFNLTHWSIAPQPIGWFNEVSFFNGIDQGQIKEPVMALTHLPVLA
jgi:hypothetical protein